MELDRSESNFKVLDGMRLVLINSLDLLMPGEEHSLMSLQDEEWNGWNGWKEDLFAAMTAGMIHGSLIDPVQHLHFETGTGALAVELQHVVNDYWWVECHPAHLDQSGEAVPDIAVRPAMAMLRVRDSSEHLPGRYTGSPRFC